MYPVFLQGQSHRRVKPCIRSSLMGFWVALKLSLPYLFATSVFTIPFHLSNLNRLSTYAYHLALFHSCLFLPFSVHMQNSILALNKTFHFMQTVLPQNFPLVSFIPPSLREGKNCWLLFRFLTSQFPLRIKLFKLLLQTSVTRLGDLWEFGHVFKAFLQQLIWPNLPHS